MVRLVTKSDLEKNPFLVQQGISVNSYYDFVDETDDNEAVDVYNQELPSPEEEIMQPDIYKQELAPQDEVLQPDVYKQELMPEDEEIPRKKASAKKSSSKKAAPKKAATKQIPAKKVPAKKVNKSKAKGKK